MGMCLAAGWTEHQFWYSTYRAVYNLIRAVNNQRKKEHRRSWEQTRRICEYLYAPYRKKGDKKPVFKLPWDEEAKLPSKLPTREFIERMRAKSAAEKEKVKANGQS